jgi:hypothetical protein
VVVTITPLSTIIALARAGSLEHAWYRFAAAGYDRRDDDPAPLNVKGRLLKDRALRARGEERRRLYLESAAAYRRSAELQPGTYPLINAATLSLLSGDRAQAAEIAREVLERIEREPDEPETPYWRGATIAEALLLLGRSEEAKAELAEAIAAAPRAWEDHASTLRQFILIHEELGADADWLAILRPPRSLSYSGSAVASVAPADDELHRDVAELVVRERVGFVFGALSAGAEIIAAEAAIGAGAELHIVLPGGTEAFARASVGPTGDEWRGRFDAVVEAAESLHMVRPIGTPPSREMLLLAERVAAGAARLNAERLMSTSLCLPLGQPPQDSEHQVSLQRGARPGSRGAAATGPLALLAVSVGKSDEPKFEAGLGALRDVLSGFKRAAVAPHLSGDDILVGFEDIDEAAGAARAVHAHLRGNMPLRIAGHYGFISLVRDPFVDAVRPSEGGARILRAIAEAAPPDTICVSLDFAAALATGVSGPRCAHWIGELHAFDGGTSIPLYALRPVASDD